MSVLAQTVALASTRTEIASFLEALVQVYTIVIIASILVSLVQTAGMRIPYNALTGAIFRFLNDAVEPYLGFFRRFIPTVGPFDFSPIVAILALQIVGGIVVSLVRG